MIKFSFVYPEHVFFWIASVPIQKLMTLKRESSIQLSQILCSLTHSQSNFPFDLAALLPLGVNDTAKPKSVAKTKNYNPL